MSFPYVLLDRDGTLIKHIHHLVNPDLVELLPDVISGLKYLKNLKFRFGIISNQSVIGRGLGTREQINSVNAKVLELLAREDIQFDFVFLCPHIPGDGCSCRKPAPGLGRLAIRQFDLDPASSFMLGDQPSDVTFGHAIGCRSIQILPKRPDRSEASFSTTSILQAAHWIETELSRS